MDSTLEQELRRMDLPARQLELPKVFHILFIDAYDSFSHNIIAMFCRYPNVIVSCIQIDDPRYLNKDDLSCVLSEFHAVICGPGPGTANNAKDVGIMETLWELIDTGYEIPILGICLGFQSMARHFGGKIRRLRGGGLHGRGRCIEHAGLNETAGDIEKVTRHGGNIFEGVPRTQMTLYHSLCVDIGQDAVPDCQWEEWKWTMKKEHAIIPLAWHVETRADSGDERILMALKICNKPMWGLQYHPESAWSWSAGDQVIENWMEMSYQWIKSRSLIVKRPGEVKELCRLLDLIESIPNDSAPPVPVLETPTHLSARWYKDNVPKPSAEYVPLPMYYSCQEVLLGPGWQPPDIIEILRPYIGQFMLLDSSNNHLKISSHIKPKNDVRGKFSIIACNCEEAFKLEYQTGSSFYSMIDPSSREQQEDKCPVESQLDVWNCLKKVLLDQTLPQTAMPSSQIPFIGGWMGYMTYEMGLENIGVPLPHTVGPDPSAGRGHDRPDISMMWVTMSIIFDHQESKLVIQQIDRLGEIGSNLNYWPKKIAYFLQSQGVLGPMVRRPLLPNIVKLSEEELQATYETRRGPRKVALDEQYRESKVEPSESSLYRCHTTPPSADEYLQSVKDCQDLIAAGETYELCMTTQAKIRFPIDEAYRKEYAWSLYKHLRQRQPAPFASFIQCPTATLISASPERFLSCNREGLCTMRPMKGTVPKGGAITTMAQAKAILHTDKEIAENLMIVDLVRHDLQSICESDAVEATQLMKIEEYASVFTMVTVIEAQLPEPPKENTKNLDKVTTAVDAVRAAFPPGSMTGAPKKRSCQLLTELEGGCERSLYSGIVGYFCVTGAADFSVTIRSVFSRNRDGDGEMAWVVGAGGAVTALSTPRGETDEMFVKMAGPLGAVDDLARRGVLCGGVDLDGRLQKGKSSWSEN